MFKKVRVATKIILPIIVILTLGNITTTYLIATQMYTLTKGNAKDSLDMLSESIFLTLRNAMNTGDPIAIKKAEDEIPCNRCNRIIQARISSRYTNFRIYERDQ